MRIRRKAIAFYFDNLKAKLCSMSDSPHAPMNLDYNDFSLPKNSKEVEVNWPSLSKSSFYYSRVEA